jgi:hypothetical protein
MMLSFVTYHFICVLSLDFELRTDFSADRSQKLKKN